MPYQPDEPRVLTLPECEAVGLAYIDSVALEIPPALRIAVATSAACRALNLTVTEGANSVVDNHQEWFWRELAEAHPFDADETSYFWESDAWFLRQRAAELEAAVYGTTLQEWLGIAPTQTIKMLAKELLPTSSHKLRKVFLVHELKSLGRHPRFKEEFEKWKRDLLMEESALLSHAAKPPIPRHTAFLVQQTTSRIQNAMAFCQAPRDFVDFWDVVGEGLESLKPFTHREISGMVDDWFDRAKVEQRYSRHILSKAKRVVLDFALKHHDEIYRQLESGELFGLLAPSKARVAHKCCEGTGPLTSVTLPPYTLACGCKGVLWTSKKFPKHRTEQSFEEDYEQGLFWALVAAFANVQIDPGVLKICVSEDCNSRFGVPRRGSVLA